MNRSKQLGEERIGKLLMKFSLPAIAGMLVNALYNVVDRAVVGNVVGKDAIAGLTITMPIAIIIMAFGMLIGIGAAARVSIRLGQNKKDEAEKILGNAFILLIAVSLLVTVFGQIFKEDILRAFGASDNTIGYAIDYITIILYGAVLQNIGFGLNNIIRAEGNPKIAMFTMLIGGVLNIILDILFVLVFKFGIKGAAYATIISQAVNTIWVLYYFVGENCVLKLKIHNFKLKKSVILSIVSIGFAPFSMQVAASMVQVLYNTKLASFGGDTAIAVFGAINSIVMLILMPVFGINQGSQPIIGYNYGAKNYKRVKKTLKLAAIAATFITTSGFLMAELVPSLLIKLFNRNSLDMLNMGTRAARIYLCMFPIIGFQIVCSNYFQAIGKATIAMILSLARQVIVLIPLLLILPQILKLDGIWISGPISDFISSLITLVLIYRELKKLNKKIGDVEHLEVANR
ncbi:multidrug export protein MepA [Clostridium tepidiprofundi DSM 19306]|uniref:Multidrug export protein MepA n=1 Tax=Clostridium tepidiprofundi DSM 19306 TaxID=1121338 RepID=A0A151B3W1_9CLOT|nr:MATE family efflux transporter [Clostridium tepidiprofundi]KYH34337.1 multidrug export protein MepA [Clostridium tepidiprofundi DSM 19306]